MSPRTCVVLVLLLLATPLRAEPLPPGVVASFGSPRWALPGCVTALAVSPDGRYIAINSVDPASRSSIKLLFPTAGGDPREVMRVPAGVEPEAMLIGAQWALDSRSLFTM